MVILNTHYNILSPHVTDIRKRVVAYEDTLQRDFLPYEILPIPDNAPPDIPRITMETKGRHSMLQISLSGASFQTAYDEQYNQSWDMCREYLEHRASQVYDIMSHVTNGHISTQGFIAQIIINNLQSDPVAMLQKNIAIAGENCTPWDIGGHVTVVKQDKYYINVRVENARLASLQSSPVAQGTESGQTHCLLLTIEVNDRKLSNENNDYISQKSAAHESMRILHDVIANQVNAFVSKGVFML